MSGGGDGYRGAVVVEEVVKSRIPSSGNLEQGTLLKWFRLF